MNRKRLQAQLEIEEGRPPRTYLDHKGILTGGVGHNLKAKPDPAFNRVGIEVTNVVCTEWFNADIDEVVAQLDAHLPWWREQDDVRQTAMGDLTFNMGIGDAAAGTGLLGFKNTLAAWKAGHYDQAAAGLLNSQYAKDVGYRSKRIADMVRTGEWPADIPFKDEPMPDFKDVQGGVA